MNKITAFISLTICLLFFIASCSNKSAKNETQATQEIVDTATDNSDYYEYTKEGISDQFIGKYDIKPLLKKREFEYHSVYESEVYFDSLKGEKVGYTGSVNITNFSRKGFDFDINVISYSHSNGGISGRATFDTANRAYSSKIEPEYTKKCLLTFTFL